MAKSEIDSPGPSNMGVGKPTSGQQDQGSNIDVTNYATVNTGGPKTEISTEFECSLGKEQTGKKDGVL